jgi:hypothetical protein
MIGAVGSTKKFFIEDQPRTLFPLKTSSFLIEKGESAIKEYILKALSTSGSADFAFNIQPTVYADKPGMHFRRTLKLDPIAEYCLYDIVYRNRGLFRKPHSDARIHFGYRFEKGNPINSSDAYKQFKREISFASSIFKYSICFDVSSYFNCIYHHDITNWFSILGAESADVDGINKLLLQIKGGRSVDCLPHGIYPSKMIGNDFLHFVDNSMQLRCGKLLRFMDDIYLFSDSMNAITHDFLIIQKLLGDKHLSVNSAKTRLQESQHTDTENEIDNIKKKLLDRRRKYIEVGYDDGDDEEVEVQANEPLSEKELDYISAILNRDSLEEDDAELILSVMKNHTHRVDKKLDLIASKFPHLSKSVYSFSKKVPDKASISSMVKKLLLSDILSEYQLFWYISIIEEVLIDQVDVRDLIRLAYIHPSATEITKAKIL